MNYAKVLVGFVVLTLVGGVVWNQEAGKEKPAKEKADKPVTHKVEKKPFKIERTLKGILAPEQTAEISYRAHLMVQPPASHGTMTIRKIVEHGAKVKQGDVLVVLDTTKLQEVIETLEMEQKVLQASIKLTEEELPLGQKSAPAELAAAETAKNLADEDLKYFLETGKPQTEKRADMSLKTSKFYLEYAEEELRQLEKMYKANDLTEETERIILRRQQNYVEMAKFYYQSAVIDRDYLVRYGIPNKEKSLRENQVRQDLNLEKTRKTQEPATSQKQASLARMQHEFSKNQLRMDKLVKDRAAMTIAAPMDGIVYHGKFHQGQWTTSESLENRLVVQGSVQPDEVFLTVVKPRPVVVHVSIDEKDVHLFKTGLQGTARLLFHPDRKLPARVMKVGSLPTSPGKFAAQLALGLGASDADLMPGMACSIVFVPYSRKDAITLASRLVHDEDDKSIVYVQGANGKQERREVTTGRTEGEQIEIVSGLREGELVLEKKSASTPEKGTAP